MKAIASRGVHRRIEATLLGKVADFGSRFDRPFATEYAARSARRVDDAHQHPQGRCLAGAVGTEQAVDRAGGNRETDPVHGARLVEILDEIDSLNREIFVTPNVLGLSKHCFP